MPVVGELIRSQMSRSHRTADGDSSRRSCDGLASTGSSAMQWVWFILIGIAAGWLAGQIMKGGGYGLVGDLVLGVLGALLGGWIFSLLGISFGGTIGALLTAVVGAVVLIYAVRLVKK